MLRGRLLEAMKSYQRLATMQPETVEASLALGKIYLDSGLLVEAFGVVARVLEQSPSHIEGHILLRRLDRASRRQPGLGPDLEQPLARHRDFLPTDADLRAQRTKLESEMAELDAEIREHSSAVEEARGEPAAEFSLQMARVRRARLEEALDEVKSWEARHEEAEAARRRAQEEEERLRVEAEEEERRRRAVEEEERRRQEAEEEERQRQLAEDEERHRREEEERLEQERLASEAAEAAALEASRGTREREAAYIGLRPGLDPVFGTLLKTKGVTSVLIVARDGCIVHKTDDTDAQALSRFVVAAQEALATSGGTGFGTWQFWVLEYARGILVLQRVNSDYFLLVVGQAGANFGVLTWTIDKNKAQLEGVLAAAPSVPADGES